MDFFFGQLVDRSLFSSAQLLAETFDKESCDAGYLTLRVLERKLQVLDRMAFALPHAK